jgi:hypothetical protein
VRAEEAARQNSARLLSLYNIREVFGKVWSRRVMGPFEISDSEVPGPSCDNAGGREVDMQDSTRLRALVRISVLAAIVITLWMLGLLRQGAPTLY